MAFDKTDNDSQEVIGSPSLDAAVALASRSYSMHENTEQTSPDNLLEDDRGGSSHNQIPFFADAILDLDEAHDIADTPEVVRPRFDPTKALMRDNNRQRLQVPSLTLDSDSLKTQQQRIPQHQFTKIKDSKILSNNGHNNMLGLDDNPNLIQRSYALKTINNASADTKSAFEPTEADETFIDGSRSILNLESNPVHAYADNDSNGDCHIDNEKASFSRISNLETDLRTTPPPARPPRWPRDIPWTVAFVLFVPISLFYPIFIEKHEVHLSPLTRHPLSTATLHALWWTTVATAFLCRLLYRSSGGAEGDDARSVAATLLTFAAPVSVVVYLSLAFIMFWSCPQARWAVLIPLWYTVRDVFLFRRWKRRTNQIGGPGGYASRQAFFHALVCMALDILARSLRKESFYRVLTAILLVQLGVLILWRWALLGALGSGSWIVILLATVGGKWATGTVARTLSLLASGGVMSWCYQQAMSLDEIQDSSLSSFVGRCEKDNNEAEKNGNNDEQNWHMLGYTSDSRLPDAYRTVDASVYRPVLAMDDVLDDDYEDDDVDMESSSRRVSDFSTSRRQAPTTRLTVKAILFNGLAVSFGSIAHCGLFGGLAQFIWSQLRKVEAAQTFLSERRALMDGGLQGMQIGDDNKFIFTVWRTINIVGRNFVRNHSDLAMTHVALYYKGYSRAARDVATLVDESGVEPILHDDITTHICSCIGGTITGIVVITTGSLMVHHRKNYNDVDDLAIVENMLVAFILSYTLIFTVMEPLRASVKAVYISFAHYPRSISQTYPLIFHRLCRVSESNLT